MPSAPTRLAAPETIAHAVEYCASMLAFTAAVERGSANCHLLRSTLSVDATHGVAVDPTDWAAHSACPSDIHVESNIAPLNHAWASSCETTPGSSNCSEIDASWPTLSYWPTYASPSSPLATSRIVTGPLWEIGFPTSPSRALIDPEAADLMASRQAISPGQDWI